MPPWSKRDVFLELGGFNKNLSCPGEPGIGFDFEYSVRLWYNNFQVALIYSDFMRSHCCGWLAARYGISLEYLSLPTQIVPTTPMPWVVNLMETPV